MVHATDIFAADSSVHMEVLPAGAVAASIDMAELAAYADSTPPDSPRPSSPQSSSDGDFPAGAFEFDYGKEHGVPAPSKFNSPVMWSAGGECAHADLPGKLSGLAPSWEEFDATLLAKVFHIDGLRSAEDSILSLELCSFKRKVSEEDELEARKAKARKCRDALTASECSDETPEAKRATHNVLERKRRHDLKTCYADLRGSIPTLVGSERASTAVILQRAVEYIESLKKMDQDLSTAMAALAAENQALRARLK